MSNYVCIRATYYLQKLWRPGDILPEGVEPNKHFVMNGKPVDPQTDKRVYGPGDDPRSTEQIRTDLKEKFGIEIKSKSRKAIWNRWKEAAGAMEDAAQQDANASGGAVTVDNSPGAFGRVSFDNPIMNKDFLSMTPDDIDTLTAKEICEKLKAPPYSLHDVKPIGISKADLVKKGISVEEQIKIGAQ